MATIRGTPINFGFTTETGGFTATNLSGKGLLQSAELSEEGDVEEVRDADGDLAAEAHYNRGQRAVLEIIIIDATNIANAINNCALGTNFIKGAFFPITACTSMPELIDTSGAKWRIMEARCVKGNTNAARLNVTLVKHAGIVS